MKSLLIQLVVLPRSLIVVGMFCSAILLMFSLSSPGLADEAGDEFPGQTQGGGTHWNLVLGESI